MGGGGGQLTAHCRCPVGSQRHDVEQVPTGPPALAHPDPGEQNAPWVQPVGDGGGQISITHVPFRMA
jgi:hypothetical protein